MKASLLRTLWIMFYTAVSMGWICLRVIVRSYCGKLDRQRVDALCRDWSNKVLQILKLKYELVNPHKVRFDTNEPTIIMINHSSLYDIPLTVALIPASMRMLAKKELFRIPLFGRAMQVGEHICIDRQNRQQAIKDLARASEKLKSGIVIWIAPEGTRSRDGKIAPLKKGGFITAIQAGARIVPVGIRGAFDILPAKTWHFHLGKEATVHIGEPIDTSEYTMENKQELIDRVRLQLSELSGVPFREKSH